MALARAYILADVAKKLSGVWPKLTERQRLEAWTEAPIRDATAAKFLSSLEEFFP